MEKIKLLAIGDFVAPTGFATVNHNILGNLPLDVYDIDVLGVNYIGDPHEFPFRVFPASPGNSATVTGDLYGFNRLEYFLRRGYDIIYILNDIWITSTYLELIKKICVEQDIEMPKIVVYFPVDGEGYKKEWFSNFDAVSVAVVYTKFGYDVVTKAYPDVAKKLLVVPHGTDTEAFYPMDKLEARKLVYPNNPELWEDDVFIVLNVNRNQPRKRLDLSLMSFALFAADKPLSVRYHHHAGLKDAGWDIIALARSINDSLKDRGYNDVELEKRLILTSLETRTQNIPIEKLNNLYNAADIGINTSTGEGWGLTSTEHAATRTAQVVPNHTACSELFFGYGSTIPITLELYDEVTNLRRYLVSPESVSKELDRLYNNREALTKNADAVYKKFSSDKYNWKEISKTWDNIFRSLGDKRNV